MQRMNDGTAYVERGERGPALIFVHGGFCDHDDWRAQINALSARYRTIALDLPGHGQSPEMPKVSVEAFAAAVVAVQAHCTAQAAILVGHGFGCSVITEAYQQSPNTIAGIVFIEGHSLAPTVNNSLPPPEKGGAAAREAMLRMFNSMFLPTADAHLRARTLAHVASIDPTFVALLLTCLSEWRPSSPQILSRIAVPLLLLESTSLANGVFTLLEEGHSADWTHHIERLNTLATKHRIAAAGHLSPIDAPDVVNALIATFADACSAGIAPSPKKTP